MIGQITPLVKVAGRHVWIAAVIVYGVASALSAGALGAAAGALGAIIGLGRWELPVGAISGALLLACALRDLGIWRWRLPGLRRQTPARFNTSDFGPVWRALVWGADLGQGWTTYIEFAGYYGLVAWAVLGASPIAGALILGAYGVGRTLPILSAGLVPNGLALGTKHILRKDLILRANAAVLVFTAGYLLVG